MNIQVITPSAFDNNVVNAMGKTLVDLSRVNSMYDLFTSGIPLTQKLVGIEDGKLVFQPKLVGITHPTLITITTGVYAKTYRIKSVTSDISNTKSIVDIYGDDIAKNVTVNGLNDSVTLTGLGFLKVSAPVIDATHYAKFTVAARSYPSKSLTFRFPLCSLPPAAATSPWESQLTIGSNTMAIAGYGANDATRRGWQRINFKEMVSDGNTLYYSVVGGGSPPIDESSGSTPPSMIAMSQINGIICQDGNYFLENYLYRSGGVYYMQHPSIPAQLTCMNGLYGSSAYNSVVDFSNFAANGTGGSVFYSAANGIANGTTFRPSYTGRFLFSPIKIVYLLNNIRRFLELKGSIIPLEQPYNRTFGAVYKHSGGLAYCSNIIGFYTTGNGYDNIARFFSLEDKDWI